MTGSRFRTGAARSRSGRSSADLGSVTVEAALALTVLVVVLVSCLAGIGCVLSELRCADAAREAARLAARGDDAGARAAVGELAPSGAVLELAGTGDLISANVSVSALGGTLPGVRIRAMAVAAREQVPGS